MFERLKGHPHPNRESAQRARQREPTRVYGGTGTGYVLQIIAARLFWTPIQPSSAGTAGPSAPLGQFIRGVHGALGTRRARSLAAKGRILFEASTTTAGSFGLADKPKFVNRLPPLPLSPLRRGRGRGSRGVCGRAGNSPRRICTAGGASMPIQTLDALSTSLVAAETAGGSRFTFIVKYQARREPTMTGGPL